MVIELAEEDAPEYEQQKPKKNTKPAPRVTEAAAAPLRTDSPPGESKDSNAQPSSRQAKSKQKGDSHADGEGDGWETASEGSEDVDDVVATTSGNNNEEHFEDALTEEELRAVSGMQPIS